MSKTAILTLAGTLALAPFLLPAASQAEEVATGAAATGEITGRVVVVNQERRQLAIRTPDGAFEVIHVPEEVRRLDEVRINDTLTISYLKAVAIDLRKGADAAGGPSAVVTRDIERDASRRPAGRIEEIVQLTGIIEAIDRRTAEVRIRGAEEAVTVTVEDSSLLDDVAVGDSVTVTYVSAIAARIE